MEINTNLAQGKNQLNGLLRGLKSYIDQAVAKGEKPLNALAIYNKNLEKYKRLYDIPRENNG